MMKPVLFVLLTLFLLTGCSEETHIQKLDCHYSWGTHSDPESQQPHYSSGYGLVVELQLSREDGFNLQIVNEYGVSSVIRKVTDSTGYFREVFGDYGSETGVVVTLENGESDSMKVTH